MKLRRIKVNNYRTLKSTELHFHNDYCTISGKNNAGKSAVIKLFCNLFNQHNNKPWLADQESIDLKEDKTQWIKGNETIEIQYELDLIGSDDAALIAFVNKISGKSNDNQNSSLIIDFRVLTADSIDKSVKLDGQTVDDQAGKEIIKKLLSSNLLFLHNSASHHEDYYYGRGRPRSFIELVLSDDEQKKLDEASRTVKNKMKQLAKEHKEELAGLLGKLSDKYDVEFSAFEGSYARRIPFSLNLSDKNVEVPINDWGSGTQNRTFILMSILQANRIRTKVDISDRITPIVVIEEPESFLHPSAQAEFGKILRILAKELGIQIIATTHSPYMLNQEEPDANILLCRKLKHNKLMETNVVDTTGDNWMVPFAEHLGLNPMPFGNSYKK
jgi:putative ATP-dependent endonuclease of OLD family